MSDYRYLNLVRQDCPLPPGTHVVAYCRDSGGEEQDRSVAQQFEAAREYCRFHNLILDREFVDERRQGSSTDKREALDVMLTYLRDRFPRIHNRHRRDKAAASRPFGVLFWKSSRLGRDRVETANIKSDLQLRALTIIDLLASASTGIAAVDDVIDAVQRWQDEMLVDEISRNAKRGQADRVTLRDTDPVFLSLNPGWKPTGAYLGIKPGTPPMGFKGERILIDIRDRVNKRGGGGKHYVQRIVPDRDPETRVWQRCEMAWNMRAEGKSIDEIMVATRLFGTKSGYVHFFTNRIYIGEYEHGGLVLKDFVPAMVTREVFDNVQRVRDERVNRYNGQPYDPAVEPRRVASRHLLTGLVYCGEVSGELHPTSGDTTTAKRSGSRHDYYVCNMMKSSRRQRCAARRISAEKLEQVIIDRLMNDVLTLENLRPMADGVAASMTDRNETLDIQIAIKKARLGDATVGADQLADAVEQYGASAILLRRLQEREEEIRELEADLVRLNSMLAPPKSAEQTSDAELLHWINSLKMMLQHGDRELMRRVVRALVIRIVVSGKKVSLEYSFPFGQEFRKGDLRPEGLEPPTHGSEDHCSIH